MSGYVGDFRVGQTARGTFNTRTAAQAPITLAGSPLLRVYKDDGTTEDDSGITLNVDFDGRTGLHVWEIDTSTDPTFYSAGADYHVVLTAGTVDGISVVGACVGAFSVENRTIRSADIATLLAAIAAAPLSAAGVRAAVGLATANLDTQLAVLPRILGLSQDNWVFDDVTYDGDGNMIGAFIYVYDSANNATIHDGTGLLYQYAIEGTFTAGLLTLAKQMRGD